MNTYRENQSKLGMKAQARKYKFNHLAIKFLPGPHVIVTFSNLIEMSTFYISTWIVTDKLRIGFLGGFLPPSSSTKWLNWARCLGFKNAPGTVSALELIVVCRAWNLWGQANKVTWVYVAGPWMQQTGKCLLEDPWLPFQYLARFCQFSGFTIQTRHYIFK